MKLFIIKYNIYYIIMCYYVYLGVGHKMAELLVVLCLFGK